MRVKSGGGRLGFEGKGEGLPFGEKGLPLGAECVEGGGSALGVGGGGEVGERGLGGGDLGLTHVREFIEMMDRGGASICQPDISQVGGFTGILRIAEEAYGRNKRVITHGYKTNIEIAANLHFLAAQPSVEPLEFSLSHSPLRWHPPNEHFPVEEDGCVRVPQEPGLGVTLNLETVERYRFVQ